MYRWLFVEPWVDKPVTVENQECSSGFPVAMINTTATGNLGKEKVYFGYTSIVAHHSGKSRQELEAGTWHRIHGGQLLTSLPSGLLW